MVGAMEELFGTLIAQGADEEVAFAAAFPGRKSSPTAISRLLRHPRVIAAREALEGNLGAAHEASIDLDELIQMQRAVFSMAMKEHEVSAANTAVKNLAQLSGNWTQNINVHHEHEGDQETGRVVQALLAILADADSPRAVEADTAPPVLELPVSRSAPAPEDG